MRVALPRTAVGWKPAPRMLERVAGHIIPRPGSSAALSSGGVGRTADRAPKDRGSAMVTDTANSGRLPSSAAGQRTPRFLRFLVGAAWIAFLAEAALFVLFQDTYYDESGYLYEGWLAAARGWVPFRDFAAKVPPVIYYAYGLPQRWFGPSLLVGRVESVLLTAGALWFAVAVARRLGGSWAPPLVLWSFVFAMKTGEWYFRAAAYPVVAFWGMLALYCLEGPRSRREHPPDSHPPDQLPVWRFYVALVAATLLLLSRHDLLGIYGPLGVYALTRPVGRRHKVIGVLLSVLLAVGALAPLAVIAPDQFAYAFSAGLTHAVSSPDIRPYARSAPVSLYTTGWYTMMALRDYFVPIVLLAPALGHFLVVRRSRGDWWGCIARNPGPVLLAVVVVGNPLIRGTAAALTDSNAFYLRDGYIAIFLLVLSAVLISRLMERAEPPVRGALVSVCVLACAMGVIMKGPPDLVHITRPPLVSQFAEGAAALRQHSAPDARVFALTELPTVLEAGREVFPPLTHSLFAFSLSSTEECHRLLCYNLDILDDWLAHEADAVVLSESGRESIVESVRYDRGQEIWGLIEARVEESFELAATVPDTGHGRLEVYVRR